MISNLSNSKTTVLLDLDLTIFYYEDGMQEIIIEQSILQQLKFKLLRINFDGIDSDFFMINHEGTQKLLHELLEDPNIEVGFITMGTYQKGLILDLFKQSFNFGIPEVNVRLHDKLSNSIFINRNSILNESKGDTIAHLLINSVSSMTRDSKVIFVDDNLSHLYDVRNKCSHLCAQLFTVWAQGMLLVQENNEVSVSSIISNDKYLERIRLVITNKDNDLQFSMPSFEEITNLLDETNDNNDGSSTRSHRRCTL